MAERWEHEQVIRTVPLLIVTMAASAAAQVRQTPSALDRDVAARIAGLSAGLHFETADPAESARRRAELGKLTDRLHAEVDSYVRVALTANERAERVQARLRTVLAVHKPNPDYGDLPLVRIADLRAGRSMIAAYTIVRGPHDDAATIRGYRWNIDRFELAGTAGDNFAGYNMFKTELRSPLPGEFWLIAWGQAQTFNGKKVRVRVYAFDGQDFRTVWSPEDLFNATLRIAEPGFVIDEEMPFAPYERHAEYRVTVNGIVKIN